jgi:hypothetical protein
MKSQTILFILLAVSGSIILSCSKSKDAEPVQTPKYPQLAGTWTGETSQNDTIAFTVATQGSSLIITGYYYGIIYNPSTSVYSRVYGGKAGESIAFRTDNSFAFSIDNTANDTLKGTFDVNAMTLAGSVTYQFTAQPGQPVVSATYTAARK